jgi:thiamine kinase-like enzyme
VLCDFRSFYEAAATPKEVSTAIEQIFEPLKKWYGQVEPDLNSFFEQNSLNAKLVEILRNTGRSDILTAWSQLEKQWPKALGTVTAISHRDLNPTNIVLDANHRWNLIDFANAGYHHWASDFARLERQIRFIETPKLARKISEITDSEFHFKIPSDLDDRIRIATTAIRQIAGFAEERRLDPVQTFRLEVRSKEREC